MFYISYPWARIYLFLLSMSRAFAIGYGMSGGFDYYYPELNMDIYMIFFAGLFLFHWIVVMFYQAISKWAVTAALAANLAFTVFCRLFFVPAYRHPTIQEGIWFGSWIMAAIDLFFIAAHLYNTYSSHKINRNII